MVHTKTAAMPTVHDVLQLACPVFLPVCLIIKLMCHDPGTTARLRSKQQLLQTLVDRVRDQNAYTRARVLQTWAHLAEKMAVPLGHWLCVTQIAVGAFPDSQTA